MTRPPDPDTFLDFADTATTDTRPGNDLEATYLRVQRAFAAPSTTLAPAARGRIRHDIETTPQPSPIRRLAPTSRRNLNTIQAAASFIGVLVLLGALFALVVAPNRTEFASQSGTSGLNDIYQTGPNTWEFRADQCVTYGETSTRDELLAMTASDFPNLSYQVVERADESIGRELLKVFANMYYCNWTDIQIDSAAVATPAEIAPLQGNGTSYYSDRILRGELLDVLPEEERRAFLQFLCYPPVELLEESFPLHINWQAPMLNGIGAPVAVFDPTNVYHLKDGRYAAAISTISLDQITNPALREYPVMIFFYIEKDGRYLMDQFVTIFNLPDAASPQGYLCA